jgi:hypothetical protein
MPLVPAPRREAASLQPSPSGLHFALACLGAVLASSSLRPRRNPSYRHRRVETGSDDLAPPCAAPPSRWSGAAGRIPRRASLASPDRRCAIVAGHSAAAIGKRKGIGERRNLGARVCPSSRRRFIRRGFDPSRPKDRTAQTHPVSGRRRHRICSPLGRTQPTRLRT